MSGLVAGLLSAIDGLAQFDKTEVRLAVTLAIAAAVVAAAASVRYLRPRIRRRFHGHVADVVLAGAAAVIGLGATVSLLVLWGLDDTTADALARINATAGKGFKVLLAAVTLASAYIVSGFVKRAIDRFAEGHETITEHQSEIVYRVSQLTVYVSAVAVILGLWNVNLSGLIVGAGFLGIIVGMAARQTLGALLAGFVLMFSRPFEIGDWVEVDDEEGIVTDISIVNTRIQTFDGEYVMIPNDIVSGTKIVNKSRKGRLRIEVDVGVDYDTDLERAADLAEEAMKDLDEVLTVPSPQVVLKEFGGSSVVLALRFWIDKPSARREWRARTAVIRSVKQTFDREGIKIPYPQRELTGREESGGFELTGDLSGPDAARGTAPDRRGEDGRGDDRRGDDRRGEEAEE